MNWADKETNSFSCQSWINNIAVEPQVGLGVELSALPLSLWFASFLLLTQNIRSLENFIWNNDIIHENPTNQAGVIALRTSFLGWLKHWRRHLRLRGGGGIGQALIRHFWAQRPPSSLSQPQISMPGRSACRSWPSAATGWWPCRSWQRWMGGRGVIRIMRYIGER